MVPSELALSPLAFVAAVAVALALGAITAARALRFRRSRRVRQRARRAFAGERAAEALLAAHGYRLTGRQARGGYALRVDDEGVQVEVRADYLAERGGQLFVVEVKTGRSAPAIEWAATRRQLLEYGLAFEAHGLLLLDAEAGEIRRVEFPGGAAAPSRWSWALAAGLAAAGFALGRWG